MTVRFVLTSLLFSLLATPSALAAKSSSVTSITSSLPRSIELREISGHIRFTYEELDMPGPGESPLGLLGFSFLSDLKHGFYGGIAGYGALRGERGGFFTGGLAGGKTFHITSRLYADAGLFVGGGGGGSAPQGGGLMLRGHAGIVLDMDKFRLGAAVSRVDFPNGDIESDQLTLSVDFPFGFLVANRRTSGSAPRGPTEPNSFGVGQQEFFIKTQNYFPDSSSQKTSGDRLREEVQLIGFEFRNYIIPRAYWLMESSGALGGDADGYAEALFGFGYAKSWDDRTLGIEAALTAGGAGGGRVDTGGGAVAKARIGANLALAEKYVLALDGTYMEALDGGQFSAFGVGLRVGRRMSAAVKGGLFSLKGRWRLDRWGIAAEHQSYLDPQRKSSLSEHRDVHLISMQFRRYFDNSIYFLSGQAAGAYEGDAGGYASGLIGPGLRFRSGSNSSVSFHSEILLGAGGGGGLDVGSGLLVQPAVGLSYRITPSLKAGLSLAHVWAPDGGLDSHLIGFNVSTPFVLPINLTSR